MKLSDFKIGDYVEFIWQSGHENILMKGNVFRFKGGILYISFNEHIHACRDIDNCSDINIFNHKYMIDINLDNDKLKKHIKLKDK